MLIAKESRVIEKLAQNFDASSLTVQSQAGTGTGQPGLRGFYVAGYQTKDI